ncbi:VOC family protein [Nannocystis bainbridge]|uniref:VOC family protein n=1 Tax=Nannocystis bainbridge TaxID=2995303 RepID=A0ABT5ECY8_9BACT|nr:VOC family protein [Nannocystis bainbridge]MDC0723717.1 VOC family protein [Nannocystis bainbridge]
MTAVSTRATGIHHVSITVNDYERSRAFYTRLFELLGGQVVMDVVGAPHKHEGCRMMLLAAGAFMLGVWEAAPEHRGRAFDRYSVGLHHFAIAVESRAAIDEVHRRLVDAGVEILDAPAEYPYAPGYYAVFFNDPDGIKLELVHV